jgi:hypothetical protein
MTLAILSQYWMLKRFLVKWSTGKNSNPADKQIMPQWSCSTKPIFGATSSSTSIFKAWW